MVKKAAKKKSAKRPARKTPAQREKEHRLTDAYAAEARKRELLPGDELSELEAVGRKGAGRRNKAGTASGK
jgi:hypothetical protein